MEFTPEDVVGLHRAHVRCKSEFVTSHGSQKIPQGTEGQTNGGANIPPLYILVHFVHHGVIDLDVVAFVNKDEFDAHLEVILQG